METVNLFNSRSVKLMFIINGGNYTPIARQTIVFPPSHAALAQRLQEFYGDALPPQP